MVASINAFIVSIIVFARVQLNKFLYKEDGDVNVVSIVVLIGIAIVLAIIFRKAIINLLNNLFNAINNNANNAIKTQ